MVSEGAYARMAWDNNTFDTGSEPFEFIKETLTEDTLLIDDGEKRIRGTRSHSKERVFQGLKVIRGSIWMTPSPTEYARILPRLFGANASGNTYALADDLPVFNIAIYKVAKTHTFTDCMIDKGLFYASKGGALYLKLDILAKTHTEGTSFPALTIDLDTRFTMQMGTLTLQGAERYFNQFSLLVNNHARPLFNNSQTPTDLSAADRSIYLACSTPYDTDHSALYTTPKGSAAGAAGSLAFVNGGQSLTFSFANLKPYAKTPTVPGKDEIRLPYRAKVLASGATKELITVLDVTA